MSDQIKQEPSNGSSSLIKEEGGEMQIGSEDYENYEDSLDLDMSKEDTKVWLVRLPSFLMEKWQDVEKNSGKELGKVRISSSEGNSNKKEVSDCDLKFLKNE